MATSTWLRGLSKELNAWVDAGIITPAQRKRIQDRYAGRHAYHRLTSSVLILGAILIGLGIILFVSSNWQYLGRLLKVGILGAAMVACHALGYWFREEPGSSPRIGEAFLLLAAIVYGASIWLVAQIFQFPYNHADSVLAWIVGLLPIIWLMRSWPVVVVVSILAPIWLVVMMADPSHQGFLSYLFLEHSSRSALYRYLPLLAVVLLTVYRERNRTGLVITLIGSLIWLTRFLWVHVQDLPYAQLTGLSVRLLFSSLYSAYGLFLYGVGMGHRADERFNRFEDVYKLFALTLLLVGNYSLTFAHHDGKAASMLWVPAGAVLIYVSLVAGGILAGRGLAKPAIEERREAQLILSMVALQAIGMHLGLLGPVAVSVWFNLLLSVELLAFLYLSSMLQEEGLFRLALYGFAFEILGRYFDTFWKLLPRSFSFLVGGLVLILGGIYMERKRHNFRFACLSRPRRDGRQAKCIQKRQNSQREGHRQGTPGLPGGGA